jgi:hypothetical protein
MQHLARRKPWQILIILSLTSSVSGLKTLFWIDSKLHDMKFYLRMIDHTCNAPREWKLSGALSDWSYLE